VHTSGDIFVDGIGIFTMIQKNMIFRCWDSNYRLLEYCTSTFSNPGRTSKSQNPKPS